MTRDDLFGVLARLRLAPVANVRAPHKPLLLLWLFGRFASAGSSVAAYAEAEGPVSDLINEFGPPVRSPSAARRRAAMPFMHLERDCGICAMARAGRLPRTSRTGAAGLPAAARSAGCGPRWRGCCPTEARWARRRGCWFQVYLGLEAEAASIHEYDAELVPGLLQTADYYRAFMHTAPAAGDEEAIERKIAVRAARQERLTADDPPEFWAVLNEAAIRRVVGGGEAMRGQLRHIVQMADRPHISVQMLPFRAGAHPAMDGSFIILGFPEAPDPDVAYLESQTGSLYLEKLPEVDRYQAMFNHLVATALDPDESKNMIAGWRQSWPDCPVAEEVRDGCSRDGPVSRRVAQKHPQQQRRRLRRGRPEPARSRGRPGLETSERPQC